MPPRWRKILYESQGVADNYVDDSFLQEMRKNVNTKTYPLNILMFHSGVVSQQISCVVLFASAFAYTDSKQLDPTHLFLLTAVMSTLSYAILIALDSSLLKINRLIADVQTAFLFVAALYTLSPVLRTLTETISTDTTYAMTTVMLLIHLLFHNYGVDSSVVSNAVSLNAAIFASVCLASRLPSSWHVFVTVLFAVHLFAHGPVVRHRLKVTWPWLDYLITYLLAIVCLFAIWWLSLSLTVLLMFLYLAVGFVCPIWFYKWQSLKNNIYGPWDEATIQD
ncbi:phosphatidylinositol N-acetylglucosaminyltransferase subunit C-like [Oscarella lobularis]|uniref:phosphatidylinositol N-acetylglucosaminyltransferase subunit C-like n=1 Tax=Oscarella lobularis TaxID=121494 RepID=UPI003313C0CC